MVSFGSEAQLVVGDQVYSPSHVKVRKVGQTQRLHHNPLRGERSIAVYLETQNLVGRRRKKLPCDCAKRREKGRDKRSGQT